MSTLITITPAAVAMQILCKPSFKSFKRSISFASHHVSICSIDKKRFYRQIAFVMLLLQFHFLFRFNESKAMYSTSKPQKAALPLDWLVGFRGITVLISLSNT